MFHSLGSPAQELAQSGRPVTSSRWTYFDALLARPVLTLAGTDWFAGAAFAVYTYPGEISRIDDPASLGWAVVVPTRWSMLMKGHDALTGTTPEALRKKHTRVLDRVANELGLDAMLSL